MDRDLQPMLDAYRAAWQLRASTGRSESALLFEVIRRRGGLETWIENPVGRELLAKKWDSGVPPWRLRASLIREMPVLMYRGIIKPAIAIHRAFRGSPRNR